MVKKITDFSLYRWRYTLGFLILFGGAVGLLAMALLWAPGGISRDEMDSVVRTAALSRQSFEPATIIDAPYHLLQWASFKVLGVSNLSIKVPSIIIAILTIAGIAGLLRYWFRRNVAVVASIVAVTSSVFLFTAQNGTPAIMMVFWPVLILYSSLMVSRSARLQTFWKIVLFGSIALSLYTPLSLYMLLALASAALLHPHLRYIIRRMSTIKVTVALVCAAGLLTPLVITIVNSPSLISTLVGWPSDVTALGANLTLLGKEYGSFMQPSSSTVLAPVYSLGSVLLAVLGVGRLLTTKYTARSYIVSTWLVLLVPVVLFNPSAIAITFVPFMLLLAMGVHLLFHLWYRLFPKNPYARLAGLLPLAILIGGIVTSNMARYVEGYTHDPSVARVFSQDLSIVKASAASQKVSLLPKPTDASFYAVVAKYTPNLSLVDAWPSQPVERLLVAREQLSKAPEDAIPFNILTTETQRDADRFYLYKNVAK